MFQGAWFEQISGILQRVAIFGAGILAANPTLAESKWGQIAGGIIGLIGLAYGIKINRPADLVASVNALENVKAVIPMNNAGGRALVEAVASPTVKAAGSMAAAELAKPTPAPEK